MATSAPIGSAHDKYFDLYYNKKVFGEPRQKMYAIMRFEKRSVTDEAGWYFKSISQDQTELKKIAKNSIDYPATDGLGWVSNINDVMLVEIIPIDSRFMNI